MVDDRDVVRRGYANLLHDLGCEVVVSVARGEELLAALRRGAEVDLALVHLRLEGLGGLATLALLHRSYPLLYRVGLCGNVEEEELRLAYAAGVSAILLERDALLEWRSLLMSARAGCFHMNALARPLLVRRGGRKAPRARADAPKLTERELEVLSWKARRWELTRRGIAMHMRVKMSTVRSHFKRIYKALGVNDCTAAIREARRQGLLH